MQRLLLIIVLLYVVWRVLHSQGLKVLRTARGADDFGRFSRDPRRRGEGGLEVDRLVQCPRCAVAVPESTLIRVAGGEAVCSACAQGPDRKR